MALLTKSARLDRTAAFYDHIVPPATHEETQFRHSHWRERRDRVRAALCECGATAMQLNQFDECGSGSHVQWSEQLQKHRLVGSMCHNRHCEPCMRAKAGLIARNLRERIGDRPGRRFRFITLTLAHSSEPLSDQIRKLYVSFKKLRKNPLWRKSQKGGAFILEVKRNSTHWHPHLHIISEGTFINKFALSDAWLLATGNSSIVDVQLLDNANSAIHYVTKYITKSTTPTIWQDQDLRQEWIISNRGLRTCSTFGTWRGFKLLQRTPQADDWITIDTLTNLCRRARGGEQHAWQILLSLRPPNDNPEID